MESSRSVKVSIVIPTEVFEFLETYVYEHRKEKPKPRISGILADALADKLSQLGYTPSEVQDAVVKKAVR